MSRRQIILEKLNRISQTDDAIMMMASAMNQINQLMEKSDLDYNEVVKFVEKNPMMTAIILKAVNSSHYGFVKKIETVSQAVNLMGIAKIKTLFTTTLLKKTFQAENKQLWNDLWKHSLGVATIAKALAKYIDINMEEHLFTAGLMHDIGSFILYFNIPEETQLVFDKLKDDPNKRLLVHEKEVLGITHDEIGYLFARVWKFPEVITNSIRYHHFEGDGNNKYSKLIAAIKIANSLAKALEFGKSENYYVEPLTNRIWRAVQMPESDIPKFVRHVKEQFRSIEESMQG